MVQNHQKGRTIFGVIAAIAIIALLCLLFVYICKSTHASSKSKEIAEAVAVRTQLYCPDIPMVLPHVKSKKYTQNGPYGTTIILQNEQETPQPKGGKLYFSVVVDTPSKSICKKLVKTDLFKAEMITIDEDVKGQCPGVIRFYFTCPYKLDNEEDVENIPESYDEPYTAPHFTFANQKPHNHEKLKCKEPVPYEDKNGNCVECITASQCHESQDCVENMCLDCPEHSNRTVRIGKRIGTRNCYCQEGYQLDADLMKCVPENDDWDITQNCIGNHCSVCPENANHNKGQRVGATDCYCKDGYLPRQTGTTQWQCAKVVILYPEPSNQIIVHDEKYPVPAPSAKPVSQNYPVRPKIRDVQPVYKRNVKPTKTFPFENIDSLFEPVFMPQIQQLPFLPDAPWDIQAWESVEIIVQ